MIYMFFKPLNIKQKEYVNIPQLEMEEFVLYEFDTKQIKTIMLGGSAKKYDDRYEVKNIDYTDNSNEKLSTLKAKNALYKDDVVYLDTNVTYTTGNDFLYKSSKAIYNKNKHTVVSDAIYTAYLGKNVAKGDYIRYNRAKNKIYSKNIDITYQLGN